MTISLACFLVGTALSSLRTYPCVPTSVRSIPASFQQATSVVESDSQSQISTKAVRTFVQEFYDRHLIASQHDLAVPSYFRLLAEAPTSLSQTLLAALRVDSIARYAVGQEQETLNFDPFLASQDPCETYGAGAVTRHDKRFKVAVTPICRDSHSAQESVEVWVVIEDGHLRIDNVSFAATNVVQLICGYVNASKRTFENASFCGRGMEQANRLSSKD